MAESNIGRIPFDEELQRLSKANYSKYSKYFSFKLKLFFELEIPLHEAIKCLILDLNHATITLTNNVLERALKLALIQKNIGRDSIPVEDWNSVYDEPNKKYNSLNLSESICLCKAHEMITLSEKDFLNDIIRDILRNGFSHGDPGKILKDAPEMTTAFYGSLTGKSEIKRVELNQKAISPLQAVLIDNFAKENAPKYFDYTVALIEKIEIRILELRK